MANNSSQAIQLRAFQEMANNSPQAIQLRAFQEMANNSSQAKQAAQLQGMAHNYSARQYPIQKKENNTGLPDTLKTGIENLSGYSMDDIKVHRNSDKPAHLHAHAFAQGTDIHLGPGQEKHLPHEAWHVVQQKQGRVKPTMQMKGEVSINDDAGLEKEADVMGEKALQMKNIDEITTGLISLQSSKSAVSSLHAPQLAMVQLRPLNMVECEDLADAKKRLASLQERYETHKALIADALRKRGGFGNVLGYFQDLGWDHATEEVSQLDAQFQSLKELSVNAPTNHKVCSQFISKVNFYDRSGGMNRFFNIYKDIEKGLLSKERNNTNQFTEMDEVYFRKYLAGSKSPITVYRGDGRDVTSESFDTLPFTTMPAGGTPDITFAGVVEHTHTNTLKNGMVSCTTEPDVALHFATADHQYGVVWELILDNYIHVINLLKARNFKYRFPGQFEVLYPGAIPGAKIVSATLYNKKTKVKTRNA
jgi:hypothetical protein